MDLPPADAPAAQTPPLLSALQARILGCLIEKQFTTPDQYPLSLNGLVLAVNQKSNRDPVMEVGETAIQQAVEDLRYTHRLVTLLREAGARVPKFIHELDRKVTLDDCEKAVLCELLIRGPQTAAELRARASRIQPISDVAAAEKTLEELMARTPPLVARLAHQPGRRETRFAHLLCGEPLDTAPAQVVVVPAAPTLEQSRVETLETRVAALESELSSVKTQLQALQVALGVSP